MTPPDFDPDDSQRFRRRLYVLAALAAAGLLLLGARLFWLQALQ